MNKEIELKAPVFDPDNLKGILIEKYGDYTSIDKDDIYYRYPSGQLARLRKEGGSNCITVKKKTLAGGIEINDELEFRVDDGESFLSFMQITGAEEYLSKIKKGYRFLSEDGAVIELCEVSNLGWFIEIEKVVPISEDQAGTRAEGRLIDDAKSVILGVLESLGIPESRLEHRYYSELLLGRK
ncbi:MAG: class IV adenylate cyclase [Spirochaetales bacterium]|nr:class IV adenylate cyclase [Spirochaetales bacterium]